MGNAGGDASGELRAGRRVTIQSDQDLDQHREAGSGDGVLVTLCDQFTTATQQTSDNSAAAASLGVLSKEGRQSIAALCKINWAGVSEHLVIDKMDLRLAGRGRRSEAVWVGAAGMRTPVRAHEALTHRDTRQAAAFGCLSAMGRFSLAALLADSTKTGLSAGISFPSSSYTAMMVGLLGL